jgi:hypothetical protein
MACALGCVALAGCATPGYDPPRLQSQLEHAGATPAQAACVTQHLSDKYDENQLGSHSPPTAKEIAAAREIIVKECKVTLPLNPLPS